MLQATEPQAVGVLAAIFDMVVGDIEWHDR